MTKGDAAVLRLTKWCDLMETPPAPGGYAESDDYIHAVVYDDAPGDVVLSDDIRLLLAERMASREALEPFAEYAELIDAEDRSDEHVEISWTFGDRAAFDLRSVDFRRARSALQGNGGS